MMPLKRTPVTLESRREPHIFLSHNSSDKDLVRRLATDLNHFGLDGWLDEWEIEAGDSLHQSIANALERCRYVGVVISPAFIESKWCNDELVQSLSREKRQRGKVVIPLLCEDATPPGFIEDRLYLDFSENYYVALVRLCALLHGLSQKRTSQTLAYYVPQDMSDTANILTEIGWKRTSLVDSDRYAELCAEIQRLIPRHPSIRRSVISVDDGKLSFYSDLVDHLDGKVEDGLLDLFRPFS